MIFFTVLDSEEAVGNVGIASGLVSITVFDSE